jgi:hypothetical protein
MNREVAKGDEVVRVLGVRSRVGLALLAALVMGGVGCTATRVGFSPIGALTLQVTAEQEADVVWLVRAQGQAGGNYVETVLRCHNTEQGPLCVQAKVPQ